jgi:hypothetical protein
VLKFLFWNLNGKALKDRVATLARNHDIDVVVLAECVIPSDTLLQVLQRETGQPFTYGFTLLEEMPVYARFPERSLRTLQEDPDTRLSLRQLILPSGRDILLAVTHFPSKLYWSNESQSQECTRLADAVRRSEVRVGHSRTILVGDLNMNPFETGVVSCHGLHATMARQVARRENRTVRGRDYPFFYNPMWGYFGDALDGPPGTYYDARGEAVCYFWNVFDQVLVRPALLEVFRMETLKILDSDGAKSLLSPYGLPDDSAASDHLPIVFGLDV